MTLRSFHSRHSGKLRKRDLSGVILRPSRSEACKSQFPRVWHVVPILFTLICSNIEAQDVPDLDAKAIVEIISTNASANKALAYSASTTIETSINPGKKIVDKTFTVSDGVRYDLKTSTVSIDPNGNQIYAAKRRAVFSDGRVIQWTEQDNSKIKASLISQSNEHASQPYEIDRTFFLHGRALIRGPHFAQDLSGASDLLLNDATEDINGNECLVLEGTGLTGLKYKVWLDPKAGFSYRKMEVAMLDSENGRPRLLRSIVIDSFEFIDGLYFPASGQFVESHLGSTGEIKEWFKWRASIEDINPNPDFRALNAFEIDMEEGTRIVNLDLAPTSFAFVWRNGQVIPDVDDAQKGVMDEIAASIKSEPGPRPGLSLSPGSQESPRTQSNSRENARTRLTLSVLIVASALVLASIIGLLRIRQKRIPPGA